MDDDRDLQETEMLDSAVKEVENQNDEVKNDNKADTHALATEDKTKKVQNLRVRAVSESAQSTVSSTGSPKVFHVRRLTEEEAKETPLAATSPTKKSSAFEAPRPVAKELSSISIAGSIISTGSQTSRFKKAGSQKSVSISSNGNTIFAAMSPRLKRDSSKMRRGDSNASKKRLASSALRMTSSATRMTSRMSSRSSRVNVITDSACVIPTLGSYWSLTISDDVVMATEPVYISGHQEVAQSMKEKMDRLEDADYMDTVGSQDSASSLLRRSNSVPAQYSYKPRSAQQQEEDDKVAKVSDLPGWRQTMADIPENVDSLTSQSSAAIMLAKEATSGSRILVEPAVIEDDEEKDDELLDLEEDMEEEEVPPSPKTYMRNLFILSASYLLVFTAYLGLRNLQSSLFTKGGLGLLCLSSIYACFFIGCIFTTTIVQYLRPKNTMLISFGAVLLFLGCNFYPHFYTLIPGACFAGFWLANCWTAQSTYMTNIAISYSESTGKSLQNILVKFNGIFFIFFQLSQIIGGTVSSLVLAMKSNVGSEASNETAPIWINVTAAKTCGSKYCPTVARGNGVQLEPFLFYLLLAVFSAFALLGLILMWIFLDKLQGDMEKQSSRIHEQLGSVFKFFMDWRALLLSGVMFYSLIQSSFMYGEFTRAFVSCGYGVEAVGYTMLCLSIFSAISAYVQGRIVAKTGRLPLFVAAAFIHATLLIFILFWTPTQKTFVVIFLFAAFWGLADGIWITQTISMFGLLFPEKRAAAFAGLKMCQSLGVSVNFTISGHLCTTVKIILLAILLLVTITGYVAMELRLRRMQTIDDKSKKSVSV